MNTHVIKTSLSKTVLITAKIDSRIKETEFHVFEMKMVVRRKSSPTKPSKMAKYNLKNKKNITFQKERSDEDLKE